MTSVTCPVLIHNVNYWIIYSWPTHILRLSENFKLGPIIWLLFRLGSLIYLGLGEIHLRMLHRHKQCDEDQYTCNSRVILQFKETSYQELVSYAFPLVVSDAIPVFLLHFWCMLGGNVWSWMKSKLFWFIEGQTHFIQPLLPCKKVLDPQWTNIECSLHKPPH